MPGLLDNVDPDGLLKYSVVYTDRAVNHMSGVFQTVMKDISKMYSDAIVHLCVSAANPVSPDYKPKT